MKIEFPILESEPLIYFLLHSGVFVFALASLFFLLGMCMGPPSGVDTRSISST
jgi:hypothetical protein